MPRLASSSSKVGTFVRQHVMPAGMTVTEAARKLGVGRPALSNLLNGRAALSQNMALRLEATFGADRMRLLKLQSAADRDRRREKDRAVAVAAYVPDFLTIKARQIEEWAAENLHARDLLPVLLRRLVHSAGRELRHVDFPGYDNAQRHGCDGRVEADAATPWVPEGKSVWEFSVAQHPSRKAEQDYQARLKNVAPTERAECTFVFVTPRNWEGKAQWIRDKKVAGDWKAVQALDASDLEQWLETTIAPRTWLAGELGIPTEGFKTLDYFWTRWAEASDPPLTAAIFTPSVTAHAGNVKKWLEKEPGDGPFTVAADSKWEAIAFLACLLRHDDVPADAGDRAVVFESVTTLRTLAQSSSPFIPVVYSQETEQEIAATYRQRHCIVVRPRNAVDREPKAPVELLSHAAFEQALGDMGIEQERFSRLASESGRSPTVLRRRLSQIPAIRTPPWSGDEAVARRLVPMALVGAWHNGSKADREILEALSGRPYKDVEEDVIALLRYDDCPVWCVDQYRGVVSKIDALFAVAPWMTKEDVVDFVDFAEYVLSESDPALDLPADQRWAAGLYGKLRVHSSALRNGICETLVLLSVHGNALFQKRLGIDVAERVADLVKRLLKPFTSDKLRSHDRDLPEYAEAAPTEFLTLLEEDLKRSKPAVRELLKTAGPSWFDGPERTGILWALERLAWNPQTLMRVVLILAELSRTKIDDNWINKPIGSLSTIFLSWLPQTAAPLDDRIRALETLCGRMRFRDIGWQVCIKQFEGGQQVTSPSQRPRWRNDAAGAGRGVSGRERYEFVRGALDLAISWPVHDKTTLGDLLNRLDAMPEEDQISVWDRVDAWSATETDDKAKADLREQIRRTVLTRRGSIRGLSADQRNRARQASEKLASDDPIRRHAWVFAAWVEYSADKLDEGDLDIEEGQKRIHERRMETMSAIWSARGLGGALALLTEGCDPWTVGRHAAYCASGQQAAVDVLRTCLSVATDSSGELDNFMQGFIWFIDDDIRSAVISTLVETATVDQAVRLFKCAPFRHQTWRILDSQNHHVRNQYWLTVRPAPWRFTESETTEIIDRLLEAKRPGPAFFAVQVNWTKVETSRLKRLLRAIVNVDTKSAEQYEIKSYQVSNALESLDGRPGVTVDEMAQLEFTFIQMLERSEHGIPNLERKIADAPVLFVQALALIFKRDDDGQDPLEWHVDDQRQSNSLGLAAFQLFQQIRRVPGTDAKGNVDAHALSQWVADVRRLCREYGRGGVGDRRIGELLSWAPYDDDGAWPCRPVCEVLESIASEDVANGFEIGVYNARGVHMRSLDEGGKQERELSAKYRAWAKRLVFDYPYVANILENIAESYDRDAEREDSEVQITERLEH